MINFALFASGTGTNVLNLLKVAHKYSRLNPSCVIVDSLSSTLPQKLKETHPHIPVYIIVPNKDADATKRKVDLESRILEQLKAHQVQWILLAGYMRIVGPTLLTPFKNRIINIHPSLLPDYPGTHSYERAFADNVVASGVTIHLVDEGMDTGPVILQKSFPRFKEDSLEDFIERGKAIEWKLYPEVLKMLNEEQ